MSQAPVTVVGGEEQPGTQRRSGSEGGLYPAGSEMNGEALVFSLFFFTDVFIHKYI